MGGRTELERFTHRDCMGLVTESCIGLLSDLFCANVVIKRRLGPAGERASQRRR